jgi:hypothetical protein
MPQTVFVSYSAKDKAAADAVVARLEAAGVSCWIAPRDVLPGADWGASILDAIEAAKIMVLIFSGNANASPQIKREVERNHWDARRRAARRLRREEQESANRDPKFTYANGLPLVANPQEMLCRDTTALIATGATPRVIATDNEPVHEESMVFAYLDNQLLAETAPACFGCAGSLQTKKRRQISPAALCEFEFA